MSKITTTLRTCQDCGEQYFTSDCPNGPHEWEPPEGSHFASESPTLYRDNHQGDFKDLRAAVLERDGYECVKCGLTNAEHKRRDDLFGGGLHIHHIVPVSNFDMADDAHTLPNLEAVCDSCHKQLTVLE